MVTTRSRTASKDSTSASPSAAEPTKKRAGAESQASPRPAKKKAAMAPLEPGARVDKQVTLRNQDEQEVALADTFRDQGVVFFMYPKANTPGCTKQACGFRDNIQAIRDAGFAVFGLSGDNPKPLANWKAKESLPFDLLSDPQHELIKYFGSSIGGSKVQRSHVVILKGGVVGDVQPKVSPAESVQRAVDFVKAHTGGIADKEDKQEEFAVGKMVTFDVELETHAADKVQFQDLIKDRGAIFFMYPKADTPGCTKQACGFNDNLEAINAAGFDVYGLGADTPAELTAWKESQKYKYTFLSDPERKLIGFFGSETEAKRVQRSHVIILAGGKVGEIEHNVTPADSFNKALAFVKANTSSKL